MSIPQNLLYTKDHEWAEVVDSNTIKIGITDHAQQSLGDVVFVELPKIGRELKAHETFGVVESIKAVSDLYCPVEGSVIEINNELTSDPSAINKSAYQDGWLIKVKIKSTASLDSLLKPNQYADFVSTLG